MLHAWRVVDDQAKVALALGMNGISTGRVCSRSVFRGRPAGGGGSAFSGAGFTASGMGGKIASSATAASSRATGANASSPRAGSIVGNTPLGLYGTDRGATAPRGSREVSPIAISQGGSTQHYLRTRVQNAHHSGVPVLP